MTYFSSPTELFIKDESSDKISSRTDIINSLHENAKTERPPLVENACVIFFKGVSKCDYETIMNKSKLIGNELILADGRFSSLVFTIDLQANDKAKVIYDFVKKCRERCDTGRFCSRTGR